MAWHHYYSGEIAEMETAVGGLRELYPEAHWSEFFLGWLRERQHRLAEAADSFERAVTAAKGAPVMKTVAVRAAALAGYRERARTGLQSLKATAASRYVSSYEIALIHAALEETERLLKRWTRLMKSGPRGWHISVWNRGSMICAPTLVSML